MGGYSKRKGSAYERHVCGLLDKWYGVPAKTFWRSRISGAWLEPGDAVTRDKSLTGEFPFIVESKFHKELNLWTLVGGDKNWFVEFWRQLDRERKQDGKGKFQLLVFKTNRSPDYVSFDFNQFGPVWDRVKDSFPLRMCASADGSVKTIVLWREFARYFKPAWFKEAWAKR